MAYSITEKNCIGCSLCKMICPVAAIEGQPRKLHRVLAERCVDCGACGRICPQGAVKDPQGLVCQRIRLRKCWDKPEISEQICIGCAICIQSCPTDCLGLSDPGGTRESVRKAVLVSPDDCIACAFCAADCPVGAIEMKTPEPF
jgi:electron transport complex protein RnfB